MKIFRNSILDVFLVLYAIVGFMLPFAIAYLVESIWVWVLLTPFQIVYTVVLMNTSMHHHTHVPIFNNKFLNRAYELFVSMPSTIPFQLWKYCHLIHHKYNNDIQKNGIVKDPISFYRYGKNGQRENVWSYIVYGLYRDLSGISQRDTDNTCSTKFKTPNIKKLFTENVMIVLYFLSIMFVNFWYSIYYLIVILLTLIANNANSYGEHYGAVDHANFRCDSIGSYGRLYNFLCFNSGYHQEHHVKPSLHWSKLPELTDTLPKERTQIHGMFMFNAPFLNDLKELFKK
jgi:fatty acid desaturase